MISTPHTKILDLGTLHVPDRGWWAGGTGKNMELNGTIPDHIIWPQPGELTAGIDRQLDKAVELIL